MKTLTHYAFTKIDSQTMLATYRGQTILTLVSRTMGRAITLNTHGYSTQTTSRALNQAFADSGLPWSAAIKKGQIIVITPDNTHHLGDCAYEIFQ